MSSPPLLRSIDAYLHAGGAPLAGPFTFEVDGGRVALVGRFEPLLRAFTREAVLASGTLEVLGHPGETAVQEGVLGLDLRDTELPTSGTARDLFATSLRLGGEGMVGAGRLSRRRADELGVGGLVDRPISSLNQTERRAVAIAHAGLGQAPAVLLVDPLLGLTGRPAASIFALVERLGAGRKLIVALPSTVTAGPEASLFLGMQRAVRFGPQGDVRVGAPGEVAASTTHYLLSATRNAGALGHALTERGHVVERLSPGSTAGADPAGGADPGRLLVRLPSPGDTRLVVEAALEVDAPLVELIPSGEPDDP